MTKRYTSDDGQLDAFYGDLAAGFLQPLWELGGMLRPEPDVAAVPYRWQAADLYKLASRSGELVAIAGAGERRVLALSNPGLSGAPFISSSLWAGVQFIKPAEVAPPHRHSASALRLILHGNGAYTVVDGDPIAMSQGDLVLTPAWTMHEHHNPSDEPMIWLDILDLPLVIGLNALFFEQGTDSASLISSQRSTAEMLYGQGPGLMPAGRDISDHVLPHSPLTVYRWADTDVALDALLEATSADQATLRFRDPTRARDIMPTLRCELTRMRSGATSIAQRQTGSRVGVVLHGCGRVQIARRSFDLDKGDIFVVPSWAPCQLHAGTDLDVFVTSDAPVLEALSLFRDEVVDAL
ncbi:cupin domain-containing protein [Mycobacterium intracellulare]|uniref:cupin domain-containing protein n=1 Tax=Mycobacterium intracellulare TaxID=1767 RepID=UPI0033649C73